MREATIEARLVREVRRLGGLCYKFTSPGNPVVPDRIVILPDGRTIYVELTTEIGRLSKRQTWQREELPTRGADVRVLKGLDQVKEFLDEVRAGERQKTNTRC